LYIWDANRLVIINQLNIHNAIINRLVFHPKCRFNNKNKKNNSKNEFFFYLDPNVLLTASQDGYAKV